LKIAIFGAGAIGCHLAALLARKGEAEVGLLARGPHLAAMRANGLRFVSDEEDVTLPVAASDDPAAFPAQDIVFVTLKAHQSPGAVAAMQPLLGPETAVVTAMNGVPWWYFHGIETGFPAGPVEAVDPGGAQWRGLGPERAVGCVVYPAAEIVAPGVCRHIDGNTYTLGEPDGTRSARVLALSALLVRAGFRAPVRSRIRDEIWVKLWGNLCFNPISALTHATLAGIGADSGVRRLVETMMQEGQAVGEAAGARFRIPLQRRLEGAVAVGEHKTSMLQDLERGRPMEIDALVGAVSELGRRAGVPTPAIDTVLALIRLRGRMAGVYPL